MYDDDVTKVCRAVHLDKCCEYWYFNYANKDNPSPEEFKFPVEMALELLIVADFLDCMVSYCMWADSCSLITLYEYYGEY